MKINKKGFVIAGQDILMPSGEMVLMLRELKGWSQMDLSKATGISQTNISAIENNKIQIGKERAIMLAEALCVHPSTIMFSDYKSKNVA